MKALPILIVGSMAFDDLEFPRPVRDAAGGCVHSRFEDVIGGSATYAAYAASCYAPVRVVAVVGDDFPEATLEHMRSRRVDTQGVERVSGKTFRWVGRYHADMVGRDSLATELNVFADFRPKIPESYRDSRYILLGNIHPALQLEVLDQVREPELVVADSMNFWIEREREALGRLLKRIDVLVINDEEARLLAGEHNVSLAAAEILRMGPKSVVVKRGEYGALYYDAEGVFAAPALPLHEVVDPTGAGDSFAGGMLGYVAERRRTDHAAMRRALVNATAAASYCVEAVGTRGVQDRSRHELAERVGRILALYRVDP
ncbi:MAG: sugar kinase [Polyangiaceae bacterium]|nr:sugar kinase [Polyangiaceae bacterium]